MDSTDILKKYWGHTKFRLNQYEIIEQVLKKNDTLAILPTGGGKSICYQIPTLLQEGICIVISPLISLMKDQIQHLQSKGIKSVSITSNMQYFEIDTALNNCIYGGVKFLYISPERIKNKLIEEKIKKMKINLIAVDEAHCISEWGHNFRPAYRNIHRIREISKETTILALTATATSNVIKDIQENLLFKNKNLIKSSLLRSNISYIVDSFKDKKQRLLKVLNRIKSSTIIYVETRRKSKDLTNFLVKNKLSANYYHAGLSIDEKNKRQEEWSKNNIRIMVATNAFGMGINKKDVKLVVHMYLPSTIESYFQEAGRAGRNDKLAYAYLLANSSDIIKQEQLLELKYPTIDEVVKVYQNIASYLHISIGELPENPIPFDIEKFSKKYKIKILKVYNILKYLEKENKLKLIEEKNSPSMLKIITSNKNLYRFQITNKYYDSFIKLLLRSHSNIFNQLVIINEEKIAKNLNISIENVKKVLHRLKQLEIINYQEQNNLSKLTFLQNRQELNSNHLNKKIWEDRKNSDRNKLKDITNYISNKEICRTQQLLNYFGENLSEYCMQCDVCIERNK